MAIKVSGPCNQFSPNASYLVTGHNAAGQVYYQATVSGNQVTSSVNEAIQAYCQTQQISTENHNSSQNNSNFSLASLFGLIGGAFLALAALRSPHIQKGIENIENFVRKTASNTIQNTREGLGYIGQSLGTQEQITNQNNQKEAVPA